MKLKRNLAYNIFSEKKRKSFNSTKLFFYIKLFHKHNLLNLILFHFFRLQYRRLHLIFQTFPLLLRENSYQYEPGRNSQLYYPNVWNTQKMVVSVYRLAWTSNRSFLRFTQMEEDSQYHSYFFLPVPVLPFNSRY